MISCLSRYAAVDIWKEYRTELTRPPSSQVPMPRSLAVWSMSGISRGLLGAMKFGCDTDIEKDSSAIFDSAILLRLCRLFTVRRIYPANLNMHWRWLQIARQRKERTIGKFPGTPVQITLAQISSLLLPGRSLKSTLAIWTCVHSFERDTVQQKRRLLSNSTCEQHHISYSTGLFHSCKEVRFEPYLELRPNTTRWLSRVGCFCTDARLVLHRDNWCLSF